MLELQRMVRTPAENLRYLQFFNYLIRLQMLSENDFLPAVREGSNLAFEIKSSVSHLEFPCRLRGSNAFRRP